MPELPEVETTLRGLKPHIIQQNITRVTIRQKQLRWTISSEINQSLSGNMIDTIERRGKYLLFKLKNSTIIMHLGMSGSLRLVSKGTPPTKHDHFDLEFENIILRFNDPRRFGAILWTCENPEHHPLLKSLGPEPLGKEFSAEYLLERCKKRNVAIKLLIMNSQIVVGVGNIYANEALFNAGINPLKPSLKLTKEECRSLTKEIKNVLRRAIKQGGTTLRNFVDSKGKPGYFAQHLSVYGRGGKKCVKCKKTTLKEIRVGQRSTVYCPTCQVTS